MAPSFHSQRPSVISKRSYLINKGLDNIKHEQRKQTENARYRDEN